MSNKSSNIKERVLQIPECKGITKQDFFKKIGMSYGNFTGKSKETPLNSNAISNISSMYPDINLDWLINGNGEMTNSSNLKLKDKSIHNITKILLERNDELMKDPVFRQYIKSNIDILDIEEEENELKEKKRIIKEKLIERLKSNEKL
ncbi:hypothetical protein [Tenacibaculum maritimum]|uniref:hypothetical protein n=1 Tax=Tenacibaculum maritimum TaxID=107401 RepID=UPI0012E40599|nr:hypothetical protein [Tenacibaculum maritimum]CAA0247700.1 hypothetical protein TMP248_60119 [Tenacibaculum maritimum]